MPGDEANKGKVNKKEPYPLVGLLDVLHSEIGIGTVLPVVFVVI